MQTLGLIGFGAFGQFLARHLRPHFIARAWNRRDRSAEAAKLGVELVPLAEAAGSEIVVFSVPAQNLEEMLTAAAPHLKPGALALDVCSVKVRPVEQMLRLLPPATEIVATHPLFGPQSGKNGIAGLRSVVCPVRGERWQAVADFFRDELKLEVLIKTPEEHDRDMAYVQALTHLVARAIDQLNPPETALTTPAYERFLDLRRLLAEDSYELFLTIQRENPFARETREKFLRLLGELHNRL